LNCEFKIKMRKNAKLLCTKQKWMSKSRKGSIHVEIFCVNENFEKTTVIGEINDEFPECIHTDKKLMKVFVTIFSGSRTKMKITVAQNLKIE
jgi:hypothetical protein